MRNSGKAGSVYQINNDLANEKIYSINDLLYLKSFEKYIKKLFNLFVWLENNKSKQYSAKQIMAKNKVDWKVYKSMKELGFLNDNYELIIKPNYGAAYALALYHRNKSKKQ